MSRTLKLVDRLLARGRHYQDLGCEHDAFLLLRRLAGFRELPAAVAEETQARLADIQMRRQKYFSARRHLTAALVHRPDCPRYHYQMALALDTDTRGDLERAAEHYRHALRLDPDQPRCLADFGLLALRLDRTAEGLAALRRAAELAADDPVVVGKLLDGLWQADHPEEARQALRAALFRNPRDGRFRKLWSDFHFRQLREHQEAARRRRTADADAEGPMLLPFLRPVPSSPTTPVARKILRRDAPTALPPPHLPRPARRSDQKHA